MSEFPKWIRAHDSHNINEVAKLFEVHHDRVAGISVLVHNEDDEAKLTSEHHALVEHEHDEHVEHHDEA